MGLDSQDIPYGMGYYNTIDRLEAKAKKKYIAA